MMICEDLVDLTEDDNIKENITEKNKINNKSTPVIDTIILDEESQQNVTENNNIITITNDVGNSKSTNNRFTAISRENKLLGKFIEICLKLENSKIMGIVINNTLIKSYMETNESYKNSVKCTRDIKKAISGLETKPHLKFSHVKNLSETFKSKRVNLTDKPEITDFTKPETIIIDSDEEQAPVINLDEDQNDVILLDTPTAIDEEKENKSKENNNLISQVEVISEPHSFASTVHTEQNVPDTPTPETIDEEKENKSEENNNLISQVEVIWEPHNFASTVHTEQNVPDTPTPETIDEEKENKSEENNNLISQVEVISEPHSFASTVHTEQNVPDTPTPETIDEEKENKSEENNNSISQEELIWEPHSFASTVHTEQNVPDTPTPETIDEEKENKSEENNNLISQVEVIWEPHSSASTVDTEQNVPDTSTPEMEKVKIIKEQIEYYKNLINILEEAEVVNDTKNSPYLKCVRMKRKIVSLYFELCQLTGSEAVKRREVHLKVLEGHPTGSIRKLEKFLNENIGSNGDPTFPDFDDVVNCVAASNLEDNMGWGRHQILKEARALYVHCSRALQKRRQKREWCDLLQLVKTEAPDTDPADQDPALLARLNRNRRIAVKKEKKLLKRFSMLHDHLRKSSLVVPNKSPASIAKEQYLESGTDNNRVNREPALEMNEGNKLQETNTEVKAKIEQKPIDITTLLEQFGDNLTISVAKKKNRTVRIEDPFLVLEVSSDSEDEDYEK